MLCMYPEDLTRMGSCSIFFFLGASLRVPQGRVVRGMNCPVNGPPLHSLPRSERRKMLVEHYGLGVFVCYLGHMTEDIFFCNNTKQSPRKRKGEKYDLVSLVFCNENCHVRCQILQRTLTEMYRNLSIFEEFKKLNQQCFNLSQTFF